MAKTAGNLRVKLSVRDASRLITLLARLQGEMEMLIEAAVAKGMKEPEEAIDKQPVALARRDWRAADQLINRLDSQRKAARRG